MDGLIRSGDIPGPLRVPVKGEESDTSSFPPEPLVPTGGS